MSEPSLESNRMPDEQYIPDRCRVDTLSLHITVQGPILHIAYRELMERTIVNEIYIEEDE